MYATYPLRCLHIHPEHQYWLVHRTKVDVPSMYRPHGRYYYTGGVVLLFMQGQNPPLQLTLRLQNWRAAVALLLSIPPNMPGLINSINKKVSIGHAKFIYDIAYIFGVRELSSF